MDEPRRVERLSFTTTTAVKERLDALRRRLGLRTRSDAVQDLVLRGLEQFEMGEADA